MDTQDRQILALLVEDGRRTYDDIGRRVALSAPAVKRRVDRLRARGALQGFT
ncbi:MAG TPA: AsnC family transcriptional regulator, partial [Solirubrobacteraceae bacterium]|nr:AsnC family transcriptional regulator [Solirubrobacteraceae bacterium]